MDTNKYYKCRFSVEDAKFNSTYCKKRFNALGFSAFGLYLIFVGVRQDYWNSSPYLDTTLLMMNGGFAGHQQIKIGSVLKKDIERVIEGTAIAAAKYKVIDT